MAIIREYNNYFDKEEINSIDGFMIPIDFQKISKDTGVTKGKIFRNPNFGWVVSGHPEIDLIKIDPPFNIGDIIEGRKVGLVAIEDNCWIINFEVLN